jgi:4-hydroxythreonine-4-phosphate dehydrogenase
VTSGEPAGIGPDLVLTLAREAWPAEVVVLGDREMLQARATLLGESLRWRPFDAGATRPSVAGELTVAHVPAAVVPAPGRLDPRNAAYVLALLEQAARGCLHGSFAAMATAPVSKAVINDSGTAFRGHTEFLAALTGAALPVMLLVSDQMRVALATTHLALRDVPAAISRELITATLRVLDDGLRRQFGIRQPRIVVLGLNPHAGESGHLGSEEVELIIPALDELRTAGMAIEGPVPADTAFVAAHLAGVDAVLAMYHDQGLPVLKHGSFGHAVNVTLGLPIVRTSVDHGTALELAGSGRADAGSLHAAVRLAVEIAGRGGR